MVVSPRTETLIKNTMDKAKNYQVGINNNSLSNIGPL